MSEIVTVNLLIHTGVAEVGVTSYELRGDHWKLIGEPPELRVLPGMDAQTATARLAQRLPELHALEAEEELLATMGLLALTAQHPKATLEIAYRKVP